MSRADRIWRADALTLAVDVEPAEKVVAHEVAGLGARFIAALIDYVIKLVPEGIGVGVLVSLWPWLARGWNALWLLLAICALNLVYSLVFELVTGGQTPGKNACALRVVSCCGRRAAPGQLLVRNLLRTVDWLPFLNLAGTLSAFFSPAAQRLGDRAAGTVVVYDDGLRELLGQAKVPESVYSTSEDGYLLEAFLLRYSQLREEVKQPLARQLAQYFYRNYPSDDPRLKEAYGQMQYLAFLQELARLEKEAQS